MRDWVSPEFIGSGHVESIVLQGLLGCGCFIAYFFTSLPDLCLISCDLFIIEDIDYIAFAGC